jgi:repressor LexA
MILNRFSSVFYIFPWNIIVIMINNDIINLYCVKGDKKMIGDRVKELRKLLGMTQKDLAEHLGLKSQTTIAAIENSKNKPSNELLSKMADLFKVSTDFILGKVERDSGYLLLLFAEKLNKHMREANITIDELSKKLNIPKQHINAIKNAELDIEIYTSYKTVGEYLKLSPEDLHYLMSYTYKALQHNMLNEDEEELVAPSRLTSLASKRFINIPILGVVRAGTPIFASENIEGYIPLPSSMVNSSKNYFALTINGDSMNLEFQEGNIIVVEKTNVVDNGEIGVILFDGHEATVKKVTQHNNMITLIPMSTNSIHKPTMYDVEKDDVKIVGKVKYAIKGY